MSGCAASRGKRKGERVAGTLNSHNIPHAVLDRLFN